MQSQPVQRIRVWSRPLRIAHWMIAVAVLALIATGRLLDQPLAGADALYDYHLISGGLLCAGLALRFGLLFLGQGSARLAELEPTRHRARQALAVLRFYFSLGRYRLPRWHAHNPLWAPIYLLALLFMVLAAISGVLLGQGIELLGGLALGDLHRVMAAIVTAFALLHILAVFAHDAGGTGSDISAMVNGYRIVVIEPPADAPQTFSVDRLIRDLGRDPAAPGDRHHE